MEILLKRIARRETYTIGRLYINGEYICDTCEDKDRELTNDMTDEEIRKIKVYGKTAIPTGEYTIKLRVSPRLKDRAYGKKYKGIFPEVQNVPGFSGILIHPFNTAEDSLGCIGPGENKVKGQVIRSTKAYYRIMDDYILPADKAGETITLKVV